MSKIPEKIDIIIPSRIGDCILSFPALLCLKQLVGKFPEKNLKITIFSTNKLTEVLEKLDFFEIKQFSNIQKLRTIFNPSNKAFFLHTSMDNHGFFAKNTYGINITGKKIHYQIDMPYLYVDQTQKYLPEKLFNYLKEKFNFSTITISFFGMLLEIGFPVAEIIEAFEFNENSLNFETEIIDWKPEVQNYLVFCMEAAYGSKGDADRRFEPKSYFNVAKNVYEKFGLKSTFIGIDDKIKLPETNYIHDFRRKLTLTQTAQLMKYSKGYIGNDTGPMHIANLMKKLTLGIYSREPAMKTYHPIFNNLNTQILGFPEMDFVDAFCSRLV
ncbi:MAG: ADP-heptose-LPS heptosyltransferase-like protein [Candidatus Peregrinibacteria bacterium GW2011_GWC2_33_13]|nr:MAG: ADP-heptose-LPS heptosyltransferase-like protein [Candidatus Peregrinibacteria bacterium GW2011_GWC2_33_13]